ncbi:unnamed protein product [Ilex paraguariensis]|uniref:Uncharacterized protein n=1 Tax=Ilex paraguariensis TaxID=185542 RepID=A0ABC8UL62_9AQUA
MQHLFLCCSANESITVYACDCSSEALEWAKEMINAADGISAKNLFHPFQCDFSRSGVPKWLACDTCRQIFSHTQHACISDINKNRRRDLNDLTFLKETSCCIGGVDFVTLIFTLSAIPLLEMPAAIAECFFVLKPGGLLLFRDYGTGPTKCDRSPYRNFQFMEILVFDFLFICYYWFDFLSSIC